MSLCERVHGLGVVNVDFETRRRSPFIFVCALDRKLFLVADIHDVGYWVAKIESEVVIHPFIVAYG